MPPHCLLPFPTSLSPPVRLSDRPLSRERLKRTLKGDGGDKARKAVLKERRREGGREARSEGEGEGEEEERGGRGWLGAAEALSDADSDTFPPELWNCVV